VFLQNNVLSVIAPNQAAPLNGGAVVQVNAGTGLIGMPEIKGPQGVEFRTLLNPAIQVGTVVQLDNAQLNLIAGGNNGSAGAGVQSTQGPGVHQIGFFVDPSADGLYMVFNVEHAGDSRGNDWETRVSAWPHGAAATNSPEVLPYVGAGWTAGQQATNVAPPALPPDNDAGNYQSSPGAVF
jgi:hypothetical protein